MASIEKTVSIVFAGKDDVSKTIQKIGSSLDALDAGAQQIASPFAKLADGILAVDAALATLAAGGLAYAFIKSKEFESSSIELQKVLGDEIESLGDAEKAALDLSKTYGESSSGILESTANFKQAGFDIQGAMLLTKDALDLVIAGNLEAAEASEILVAILKGFKAPADEASRVVDILNEVSNQYATSVGELATGMAELSPIANQMGFSFEETAGVLTPVIEVFRSGNESAVALKTGLLRLISDTKPVQEALAAIGVAQKDTTGALRSGRDILLDVGKAFQGLDENMKIYIASELVGIRQAGRMVEVFDQLSKTTEVTQVALGAAGSAAKEVAIRLESAEVIVNRFKVGFENLGIIVGLQFQEAAKGAIEGGITLESAIEEMVTAGTFNPVFDRINSFSERLGDLLAGIAEALPEAFNEVDWTGFFDALDELGDELGSLFQVDLTDPKELANVVQGLIDTLEALTRITAGMVDFFEPIFAAVKEAIDQFNDLDRESQKAFGNVLAAAQLVVAAGVYVAGAILAIKESGVDIESVFNSIVGSIKFIWNSAQTIFDAVALTVVRLAEAILQVADDITLGFAPSLKDARSSVQDRKAIEEHGFEQVAEAMEGAKQAVAGFSGEAYKAKDSVDELGKSIDTTADEFIDWSTVDAVKDLIIKPKADLLAAETAKNRIDEAIGEKPFVIPFEPEVDEKKLEEINKTVQEKIQWTAKIDIAEIETAGKVAQTIFETLGEGVSAAAKLMGDLFGLAGKAESPLDKYKIEEQIRTEEKRQRERHESQMRLTEIQTRLAEAQLEASEEGGEAVINVQADGLKPHLEAIMWEVLEAVQVRANESQAEFLLGVRT